MRNIIIDRDKRPRPSLVTPAKGSPGDMVDESQASACSIDAIIKRYGGNLPASKGWQDGSIQLPMNRDELESMAFDACNKIVESGNSPFASVEEAINALVDGSFVERFKDVPRGTVEDNHAVKEVKDETKASEQADK